MSEKKHDGALHEGADHASPYPLSRLAPAYGLVDMARVVEEADRVLGSVAGRELELIAEQIRALQEKAREVLERAQRDALLHRAECRFKKQPGGVYHLYRRDEGHVYFSMLSPTDWGGSPPHAYEGSYRLEADQSFSPQDARPRTDGAEMVRALLAAKG